MTKLKIQYKKVKDLTPYAKNSRKHSESQVAQIAASIEKFGFNAPILLDGNNEIIAFEGLAEHEFWNNTDAWHVCSILDIDIGEWNVAG